MIGISEMKVDIQKNFFIGLLINTVALFLTVNYLEYIDI